MASSAHWTERRGGRIPIVFIVIPLFWIVEFATITVQRHLMATTDPPSYLEARAAAAVMGMIISFGVARLQMRMTGWTLRRRLAASFGLVIVATTLHGLGNLVLFEVFAGSVIDTRTAGASDYLLWIIQWFWFYACMVGLLLAFTYQQELADREAHVAALERLASEAQLRALRYQLNPHFMFNTLDSIASLILQKKNDIAERMVELLADFFRASLAINPQDDIPLSQEIDLQLHYLEIEKLRFGERLAVSIDVADEARRAFVPSLILQPLTENTVRHAVANSTTPVDLAITAKASNDRLNLRVRNTRPDSTRKSKKGTSVGLQNVQSRLQARFGDRYDFAAAETSDGGFAVDIAIPLLTKEAAQ